MSLAQWQFVTRQQNMSTSDTTGQVMLYSLICSDISGMYDSNCNSTKCFFPNVLNEYSQWLYWTITTHVQPNKCIAALLRSVTACVAFIKSYQGWSWWYEGFGTRRSGLRRGIHVQHCTTWPKKLQPGPPSMGKITNVSSVELKRTVSSYVTSLRCCSVLV